MMTKDPKSGFQGIPTKYRQTNNGSELWAALEALQGFWVPKLAILMDSQCLRQGASGKAQNWLAERVPALQAETVAVPGTT